MKKMKVVRSRKRFNGEEGSEVRDSEGNLVRFGYESDEDYAARSNAKKAAEGRKKDVEFSGRTTPSEAVKEAVDSTHYYEGEGPKPRPPAPTPSSAPKPPPATASKKSDDAESEAEARREKMLKGNFEKSKSNDAESEAEARREKMLKGDFEKSKTKTKPAKKKPETKSEEKFDSIGGGRGTFAGKTAEQEEEGRKKFAEDKVKKLQKEDKPLENVSPEFYLGPGRVLKSLHGVARSLATRETPQVAGLLGRSKNVGENLTKDMGPVEYAAGRRSMLQNQSGSSEPIRQGMNPRYRPEQGRRNAAARKAKQEEKDVQTFEGEGGRAMRKGGKVAKYAKGGSVSSASSRGDGIAQRGKTRGKMY